MRGTKLTAWRLPPVWKDLEDGAASAPPGSSVPLKQTRMQSAANEVLTAIFKDMREGLLETVGIESKFSLADERCSLILELPDAADTDLIARAIDAENVESWRDAEGKVHVAINPWYSTKDVDQAVLCAIKVVHVVLGVHAADAAQPKTFGQKVLSAISEVMLIQKGNSNKS